MTPDKINVLLVDNLRSLLVRAEVIREDHSDADLLFITGELIDNGPQVLALHDADTGELIDHEFVMGL